MLLKNMTENNIQEDLLTLPNVKLICFSEISYGLNFLASIASAMKQVVILHCKNRNPP